MDKQSGNNSLFGNTTPAKISGLAYTLAAILPQVVFLVFVTLAPKIEENSPTPDWYLYASFLIPQLSFGAIALFVGKRSGSVKPLFGETPKGKLRYYFIALAMQLGLFSLSELNSLFLKFLGSFGFKAQGIQLPSLNGFGFVGVLLTVALLPAFFEELIFRGVLLSGLKGFRPIVAALLCGALFSLYHQNPEQTLYQFVCGFAFAWLAIKSGSVFPTVVSHFLNNAFILCAQKFGVSPTFKTVLLVLSGVCLAFTALWFTVFDRKTPNAEARSDRSERGRFFAWSATGLAFCALTWILALASGF